MRPFIVPLLMLASSVGQSESPKSPSTLSQQAQGPCSVVINGNNNHVATCTGNNKDVRRRVTALEKKLSTHISDKATERSGALRGAESNNGGTRSLMLGGSVFTFFGSEGPILTDGAEPLLVVKESLKGTMPMVISTKIRDEQGNLLAEVEDNEWVHQVPPSIFDRNFNQDALEIVDAKGDVVLQAANLGKVLYVAGTFRCKNGVSWTIGPYQGGSKWEIEHPGVPHDFKIPRLCKYPSERYPGYCPEVRSIKLPQDGYGGYGMTQPLDLCQ